MAMTYLPVHANMSKVLKKGMTVVHNGGSSYQGRRAVITVVNPNNESNAVSVKYSDTKKILSYSMKWFTENFYIFIGDIKEMGGCFNGKPYLDKYAKFTKTNRELKSSRQDKHEVIKSIVETEAAGFKSVYGESPSQELSDPLDEVGYFVLVTKGQIVSKHKTQRIAEIAAQKLTREEKRTVAILKLVSKSVPRCEADIIRK